MPCAGCQSQRCAARSELRNRMGAREPLSTRCEPTPTLPTSRRPSPADILAPSPRRQPQPCDRGATATPAPPTLLAWRAGSLVRCPARSLPRCQNARVPECQGATVPNCHCGWVTRCPTGDSYHDRAAWNGGRSGKKGAATQADRGQGMAVCRHNACSSRVSAGKRVSQDTRSCSDRS